MTVDLGIDRGRLEAIGTRIAASFQIEFHSHAKAIHGVHFAEVADQLKTILATATIPIVPGLDIRDKEGSLCR